MTTPGRTGTRLERQKVRGSAKHYVQNKALWVVNIVHLVRSVPLFVFLILKRVMQVRVRSVYYRLVKL